MNLYNSKLTHDKKWIIDNFEAVLDKYILTLEHVYHSSKNLLTVDVEWEIVNDHDRDPTTQVLSHGTKEIILDDLETKVFAWAYIKEYMHTWEFIDYDDNGYEYGGIKEKDFEQYKEMFIDDLLERNDWDFLKEREVKGE
jgi:hypothetical protein